MWSERQRAMLDEMGIRVWSRPEAATTAALQSPAQPAAEHPGVAAPAPVAARSAGAVMPAQVQPGTRPTGVESMGWPALREAVAGCTACKLCTGRKQTVFGVGNERAHWMIV